MGCLKIFLLLREGVRRTAGKIKAISPIRKKILEKSFKRTFLVRPDPDWTVIRFWIYIANFKFLAKFTVWTLSVLKIYTASETQK